MRAPIRIGRTARSEICQDKTGGFAHTNLITVLNKRGEIVHRDEGLAHSIDDTLAAIRKAAQD